MCLRKCLFTKDLQDRSSTTIDRIWLATRTFHSGCWKIVQSQFLAIHIVLDSVWPIYFYSHFIFILENSSMNFVSLFQKYFSVPATFFVGSECFNTEILKFFENTFVKVIFLLIQQYWKELSNHLTVGLFIVQKHNLFSWTSVI